MGLLVVDPLEAVIQKVAAGAFFVVQNILEDLPVMVAGVIGFGIQSLGEGTSERSHELWGFGAFAVVYSSQEDFDRLFVAVGVHEVSEAVALSGYYEVVEHLIDQELDW